MVLSGLKRPLPDDAVVHRVFERHARCHPGRTAVVCDSDRLTYRELDEQANRLAHELRDRGVGRGSIVGICLDRSTDLLVVLLGALKAGAAYVPLDTTYPQERLRRMTRSLPGLAVAVTSAGTAALLAGAGCEVADVAALREAARERPTSPPATAVTPDDVCYAVFTSGSTGDPKATAVRHRGWYNLLSHLAETFRLDAGSSNLMISSFGFDISQRSLLTPLFTGATLHLLPSRHFDPRLACRLVQQEGIRTLHCAPSALYLLLELQSGALDDDLEPIDHVFVGGEPLSAGRVAAWAARRPHQGRLVNVYGVAECTDVSSVYVLREYARYPQRGVPIGRPVANTDIHLLDDDLRPVADGETGEICISGVGVGIGYPAAPELTRRRFVTADLGAGEVSFYRTGDLGRIDEEGQLACIGRIDSQVKIRGMRIDLGDVENAVRRSVQVKDAALLAVRPAGESEASLVAFVLPHGDGLDERALRAELRRWLPAQMIPHRVVAVDGLPLNPNGKVDRRALEHTLMTGGVALATTPARDRHVHTTAERETVRP